ncbi:MAG: polyphenol oxidase family protein [Thermodesulfobacteriota bacterium]|nr:polyphenol oxidase family protein [Thermodesulfobacteriota bacterium]
MPAAAECGFHFNSSFSEISTPNVTDLLWVGERPAYFRYPKFSLSTRLIHGVFTRRGGVSEGPYNSLNTSYAVGDRQENVAANLRRVKEAVGAERLICMNQSHGDGILILRQGHSDLPCEFPCVDAIITDVPGNALLVKQADCQGVIVFDPIKRVVANIHCGWRGNVLNILGSVLTRMKEVFGCRGSDLLAAVGPSLGPCCAEFVDHERIFPVSFKHFMVRENYFDLWAVSCRQLLDAGLLQENIEIAGICTRCSTDLFYSYRGEGRTGRFGTVAML